MRKLIQTDSRTIPVATPASEPRKCPSWIESFVEHTSNIDSPRLYRQWSAISAIGAVLEQKVWLRSGGSRLFPNLYIFLVGHPGVGKTRTIRAIKSYLTEVPEFHLAPTSMTAAALVDVLLEAKRFIPNVGPEPVQYNTMLIAADELGAFMHKHETEVIAVLSEFYDPQAYGQVRRGKEINIKIKSPQLSVLCGTTPSNLLNFLPDGAWEQGFMSRVILAFSDERIVGDDFADQERDMSQDLLNDLRRINNLYGACTISQDYKQLVNEWRKQGEPPVPTHPKLIHYATRRRAHLYKLSVISSVDRDDSLLITREDFNRALNWLHEVEKLMPDIFKAGGGSTDAKAMEDVYHLVMTKGQVPEHVLIRWIQERVPAHSVMRVMENMVQSKMIEQVKIQVWRAVPKVVD